jgi:REP element-mobilizing transposase RayT
MADSLVACYVHFVFSTKGRVNALYDNMRPRLFEYVGGLARGLGMRPLRVGGTDNHIHLLLGLPASLSIAKAMQLIKTNSSKWIHETKLGDTFSWQRGYGAFSVSASDIPRVQDYIDNQAIHHNGLSFEDELLTLLQRYGVDFDARYVFD